MRKIINFFMPKEAKFFDMLSKQSEIVLGAAEEFSNFLKEYNSLDEQKRMLIIEKIKKAEDKGDTQTYEIIELLNKKLVTPFDREDIHNLTVYMDDILDLMDGTSRKMEMYRIENVNPLMIRQAELAYELAKKIHSIMNNLRKLPEAKRLCEHLYLIENKGDSLYEEAISALFRDEKLKATDLIKYKDLHEELEDVFDKGKEIADVIQAIAIKYD